MSNWTVLDTETTGFSPKDNRIIEFAAARFNPDTGVLSDERLHLYINPEQPIPAEATKVHGITNEQVRDKPAFREVIDQISEFAADSILVIQNAPFDVGFLNAEFERCKRDPFEALPQNVICTRRLAIRVCPKQKVSLDTLCDRFGVDRSVRTMHGAFIDCYLLAAVYPHLARLDAELQGKIEKILPFAANEELPEDLEILGKGHLSIQAVINRLAKEQERIAEVIRRVTKGAPYESRDFEVTFSKEGKKTKWDKVAKDHLQGIDLSAYQTPIKPKMSIKPK